MWSMNIRVSVWQSVSTRRLNSTNVIDVLTDLFILRGVPDHIRSRQWAGVYRQGRAGMDTSRLARRRPTSRRAHLGRTDTSRALMPACATNCSMAELFYSLKEARIIIESWRRHYNGVRPHSSLAYKAPAPEVFVPSFAAWPSPPYGSAPTAPLGLADKANAELTFKLDHWMGADHPGLRFLQNQKAARSPTQLYPARQAYGRRGRHCLARHLLIG